jgi:hypothetical protein
MAAAVERGQVLSAMAFQCCHKPKSLKSRGEGPALYSLWIGWAGKCTETRELKMDCLAELRPNLEEMLR